MRPKQLSLKNQTAWTNTHDPLRTLGGNKESLESKEWRYMGFLWTAYSKDYIYACTTYIQAVDRQNPAPPGQRTPFNSAICNGFLSGAPPIFLKSSLELVNMFLKSVTCTAYLIFDRCTGVPPFFPEKIIFGTKVNKRLGGGWTTQLKNMRKSNWIMKPQVSGWKLNKIFELPPSSLGMVRSYKKTTKNG